MIIPEYVGFVRNNDTTNLAMNEITDTSVIGYRITAVHQFRYQQQSNMTAIRDKQAASENLICDKLDTAAIISFFQRSVKK